MIAPPSFSCLRNSPQPLSFSPKKCLFPPNEIEYSFLGAASLGQRRKKGFWKKKKKYESSFFPSSLLDDLVSPLVFCPPYLWPFPPLSPPLQTPASSFFLFGWWSRFFFWGGNEDYSVGFYFDHCCTHLRYIIFKLESCGIKTNMIGKRDNFFRDHLLLSGHIKREKD